MPEHMMSEIRLFSVLRSCGHFGIITAGSKTKAGTRDTMLSDSAMPE
jgi:hypothetical protein